MVDPSQLEEVEWYRNSDTGKILARNPETGETFPYPFEEITAEKVGTKENPVGSQHTESARITDDSEVTADIPSDYATLQEAIDDLSKRQLPDGTVVNLNIEDGHQPNEGITVENGYYGHFRVTADNDFFEVGDNFEGALIRVFGGVGPVLATDVDMRDLGWSGVKGDDGGTGYVLGDVDKPGGTGKIESGVTIQNPRRSGYRLFQGSVLMANNTTIDGSDYRPIHCTHASTVSFREGLITNSDMGPYASHGGKINFYNGSVENVDGDGVYANGGIIEANGATITGASGDDLRVVGGGIITAPGIIPGVSTNVSPGTVHSEGVIIGDDPTNKPVYAGSYPGNTPDERLDNALDDVDRGVIIMLERGDYETDRTIPTRYRFTGGSGVLDGEQPAIRSEWTLETRTKLDNLLIGGEGSIVIDGDGEGECVVTETSGEGTIEVNAGGVRINGNQGHTINVNSGGSGVAVGNVNVTINDPDDDFEKAGNS